MPMGRADTARLILLAAIWGGSFMFMRVLAPVLGPVITADLRLLIAGTALTAYFWIRKIDTEWKRNWKHYLIIGVVNSAIPFTLYSFAALHLPASYSAIINSTAPFFSAIFSALWLGEPLTLKKIAGIFLGAFGVALVARASPHTGDAYFIPSIFACLGAAFCYGIAGIYIKKFAQTAKPSGIASGSQIMAGLFLLPLIPFSPMRGDFTPPIWGYLLALALLCSSVAYLLYFRLIENLGPTKALTVTFLMPVFGMAWGALLLGETITLPMLIGAGLILLGTYFVIRKR